MQSFTRFTAALLIGFAILSASFSYAQQYPRLKDDPKGRTEFEKRMMIDPQTGEIPDGIRQKELEYVLSNETLEGRQDKNSSWTNRGPYNVGGRTRALAIDATNSNILLAGGVAGGMWRSTNGGTSWIKTTGSSEFHSVTCLAQDTRAGFTNVWYYGTGERAGNSASDGGSFFFGNGIYKSTDGGVTWAVLTNTTSSFTAFAGNLQFNYNICVNPVNGDVYVASMRGILRSQDGGTNWTVVLDGGSGDGRYNDVAVTAGGVVYATISSVGTPNKGIFRSTDGTTWANITPTGYPTSYSRNTIGLAPSNQNVVYFFINSPGVGKNDHSFYKYTYVSGNGSGAGGTWVNRSANLPAYAGSVGNLSQGTYNQYVKVKPDNENFVVIGSTNIYRSTDAFATTTNNRWVGGYSPANDVSRYPNHHPDNHAFVFFPATPNVALSGHDGGISKTTDITRVATGNEPVLWTQLNNGYITTQAYSVAIDNNTSGDARIMAGFQDNGKWYNNTTTSTTTWQEEVAGGDGAFTAIVPGTATNTRYHGTQNGSLMRSVGSPASPTDVDGIQPSTATGQLFINPFILDPNNSNIMYYAGGLRVWRNTALSTINSGYTFSGTTTGWTNMTGTAVTSGTVSALGVSKAGSANVLYYGTDNGQVYRVDGANAGTGTKVDVFTGKGFPAGYVSSISVDPNNSANVMVTFSNYNVKSIFYSANSGTSWTDVGGNLEQFTDGTGNGPSARWAHIYRTSTGATIYLVGTTTGLYRTETLSGTATVWAQEGASTIGNVIVSMITSRTVDNLIAISTHANGLYSATVTSAVAPPACAVPSGLGSSAITTTGATVSWATVSGAVSYDLQYRVNGGTTWTSVTALTTTTRALTGLTASTTYEFQVRTNCSGSSSAFSASATFATSVVTACAVPTGLASSAITTTGATVSWIAASGAVSYDLQYRVNGGTTWTSVAALTTTSRALTGLTANTTYEFQVRTNCSGSSSAFSASATFTTSVVALTYCASKGNSVADEFINRVQIGTINNLSGANAGYGNFTAQSTNVTRSASVSITITPGWTSTAYAEGYSVWVDYNRDGDFIDAGEQVATQAAVSTTPITKSFTIPATATLGSTRMRVSMKYNAIPTSCETVTTFLYGEVEDYTLNIVSTPAMNPVDLTLPVAEKLATFEIIGLYPNPTVENTATKLVFNVPTKTDVSVVLTNMHGQGVSTVTLKEVEGKIEHTLNTTNAKGGVYFVNIVTADGQRAVKKLIIK